MDEDARPPIAPEGCHGSPAAACGNPPPPGAGGSGGKTATHAPPSRQALVVPPRAARPLVAVLGAAVCASAGFGLVWWTGLGRSADGVNPTRAVAVADAPLEDATADASGFRLSRPEDATPPMDEPAPPAAAPSAAPAGGFPPQPFRLAAAEPLDPPDRSTAASAFSAGPLEPSGADEASDRRTGGGDFGGTTLLAEPAVEAGSAFDPVGATAVRRTAFEAAEGPAEGALAAPEEAGAEMPVGLGGEGARAGQEAAPVGSTSSDSTEPPGISRTASGGREPSATVAADEGAATPVGPPDSLSAQTHSNARVTPTAAGPGDSAAVPLSAFSSPVGPPASAAIRQPPAFPAAAPPAVSPDPAFDDPEAPIPVAGTTSGSAAPTALAAPSPAAARTRGPERLAAADGSRGFGMAPAIIATPPSSTPAAVGVGADFDPDAADDEYPAALDQGTPVGPQAASGVGRPGPLQLEGVQTPQVALEKRGPREVQVGRVARYETIVRNVGAAVARGVTVHDMVPAGTRLVSTIPPAAPDERGGLVWQLGDLPQGGEARVAMELMPVEEGEVGSVASVAFRADASVRSLATRPDLRIEVQPPKPVLVGSAVEMSIELSNPGTGEATGIVLEGLLPEALAHAAGQELEFDVGRLRPGESRRIDLRLSSKLPGTHPLRLVARADAGIEVEEPLRVTITAPTLELSADMPGRRYLQRPATCILSMANGGTAPARSVELAAQLPEGLKFVRANNAGTFDEQTRRVIWHLEELPAGEVGSVELVLMPVALGPQRVAVAARALDGLSDQLVESIDVEGLAALAFQVSDSEDPVEVGGFTEYVVRVGNQGTKPASGVRVTVSLLGDLEPIEASGPVRHRMENLSIVFDPLASLAPDEESVYRVRARGRRAGDQRVQVQVTSDDIATPITKEEVTRIYADD